MFDLHYESCCLQREKLRNRELWINNSDQLMEMKDQISCLTEYEAVGCYTVGCWCFFLLWDSASWQDVFACFSNPEKLIALSPPHKCWGRWKNLLDVLILTQLRGGLKQKNARLPLCHSCIFVVSEQRGNWFTQCPPQMDFRSCDTSRRIFHVNLHKKWSHNGNYRIIQGFSFWTKQKPTWFFFHTIFSLETVKFDNGTPHCLITFPSFVKQKQFSFEANIKSSKNRTNFTTVEKKDQHNTWSLHYFVPYQKLWR